MIVCIIGLRDYLLPEGKEPVQINLQSLFYNLFSRVIDHLPVAIFDINVWGNDAVEESLEYPDHFFCLVPGLVQVFCLAVPLVDFEPLRLSRLRLLVLLQ